MGLKELIFGKQIKQAHAAQYRNSTQGWLPVLDVQNGVVVTKDGRYVKILEVMPVNFYLKSAIEQQNIIFYFSSYLKIAPDNLQIKIEHQKGHSHIELTVKKFNDSPGNQHRPSTKHGQKIKQSDQNRPEQAVMDAKQQKSHSQNNRHHNHNLKLGGKISAARI